MNALELVRKLFKDAEAADCLQDVWAIITALRGPDSADDDLKSEYTTPIRGRVLDRSHADSLGVSDLVYYENSPSNYELDVVSGLDHFMIHIKFAQQAINRCLEESKTR